MKDKRFTPTNIALAASGLAIAGAGIGLSARFSRTEAANFRPDSAHTLQVNRSTPTRIEAAGTPPENFCVDYKHINSMAPGDPYQHLRYFIGGQAQDLSPYVAMRYTNQNQFLREGDAVGKFWINTDGNPSSPKQLELQLDGTFENDVRKGQAAAGLFIRTGGWKDVQVRVVDLADPKNPRDIATTRVDDTGFGEIVLPTHGRIGLVITHAPEITSSFDLNFGEISAAELQRITANQRPGSIDARSVAQPASEKCPTIFIPFIGKQATGAQ